MKKKYYIGLDQGTTGTTTLLLDEQWNVVARGYKEHTQYYPKPGWVEHDPLELWQRVLESMCMALAKAACRQTDVACIGIDNQGETVMLWDKVTGAPVYNAIVWQDRRMARYADELTTEYGELIREKTGLMADSYFSGPKIKWIIDNVDGVKEKITGRPHPGWYTGFLADLEDDSRTGTCNGLFHSIQNHDVQYTYR